MQFHDGTSQHRDTTAPPCGLSGESRNNGEKKKSSIAAIQGTDGGVFEGCKHVSDDVSVCVSLPPSGRLAQ